VDLLDHGAQLAAGLGADADEVAGIDPDDLDGTLLPLARRKMARDKQSVLASTVQMGLQRIVVDEGRIHASMDLRVDAASGSQQDVAQRDDWRVQAGAAGSFGAGLWSASASASTSIGRVRSDHQQTDEQIALRAGLRSSVDLAFRTEQVPLDRMASQQARVRIDNNARVPINVGDQGILPTRPAFGPVDFGDIPPPPTVTASPPRPQPERTAPTRDRQPPTPRGRQPNQQSRQPGQRNETRQPTRRGQQPSPAAREGAAGGEDAGRQPARQPTPRRRQAPSNTGEQAAGNERAGTT
jgi:hypothetical protein